MASASDPVEAAKVLHEFCEGQRQVRDQSRRDAESGHVGQGVASLAALPSREELIAKLLGTMQAPIASLCGHSTKCPAGLCARSRCRAGPETTLAGFKRLNP